MTFDTTEDLPEIRPSKSERKRAMEALLELGEDIVALPEGKYRKLTLPDDLKQALDLARKLPNRGAKKRQLAYVRRIIENHDASALRQALKDLR